MFTFLPPPQYDHKPTMPVIERVLSFGNDHLQQTGT
jgi:hypothetical protein